MAEYTLDQMIEKFRRNPNLKFKYVEEEPYGENEEEVIALDEIGRVVNEEGKSILSRFTLNSKFALVNEPVSFMNAVRAFDEGKIIYCLYDNVKHTFIPEWDWLRTTNNELQNVQLKSISPILILNGKWFIEEGEKC